MHMKNAAIAVTIIYALTMPFGLLGMAIRSEQIMDPMTLIRGVQSTRESLKSGRFEYKVKVRFNIPGVNSPTDDDHYTMYFLNTKMRIEQTSTKYFVRQKVDRLPNEKNEDIKPPLKLGGPESGWHQLKYLSIYDGTQMIHTTYSDSNQDRQVAFGNPAGPGLVQHGYFIDPRFMGLSAVGGANESIDSCLNLGKINAMKIVGKEVIGTNDAWHIVCNFPQKNIEQHLWIGDGEGFPVYRMIIKNTLKSEINEQIDSEYRQPVNKYFIPVKVHRRSSIDANGKARIDMLFEEVTSDYAPSLQDDFFSIKRMKLPPGTSVTDSRINKLIGYWDGEKITPDINAALKARQQLAQAETSSFPWQQWAMWMGGIMGLLLGCWFILHWRRRRQASTP